jgi:hypothetical protein
MKMMVAQINFKVCMETLNFMFDSPAPIYKNKMQMGQLANLLHDTLESLTGIAHSYETYIDQ